MNRSALFFGEHVFEGAGYPCLAYYRAGSADKPLIVFLPGAGHLARVAYGHEGANKEHFLDHWLASRGYGLLAVSYPSDYPVFERTYPEMSVSDWGRSLSSVLAAMIEKNGLSNKIVVLAWSMSGKVVGALAREACERGLDLVCFISLAAVSPLPGTSPRRLDGEPLTPEGLWDIEESLNPELWAKELEEIGRTEHQSVISLEEYRQFYRCHNPIQLRGEADRYQNGTRITSLELALQDVGPFAYGHFPKCAAIVPTSPSDAGHALTDGISWAFYTVQAIVRGKLAKCDFTALSQAAWHELRNLALSLPQRLTRYVGGGHFFFIGKTGASETAGYVEELILEATRIDAMLEGLAD